MELNRLVRVLRARWRIVALLATIGFVSAYGFTALANRSVAENWEALIALRFEADEEQTIEELAAEINDTQGLAMLAAGTLLSEFENSSIYADTAGGRVYFRAEGGTQEEALDRANQLLDAYLNSDQAGGDIEARLASLAASAEQVSAQIADMTKVLTPEQQALAAHHQTLDQAITVVREQLVGLRVADAGAEPDEVSRNAETRADLEELLASFLAEKQALEPAPTTDLSASEQLRLNSLTRQLEVIGLEHERLSLRAAGVLPETAQEELPRINPLTPAPASPIMNGVIGLVAGASLALFALIFIVRSRKEVWLPEDVPVPVLGEIPDRKVTVLPGPAWYDTSEGSFRKEAIQATRSAVEGVLGHEPAALAIVGDNVGATATHALAVDLAASFASAGRSVLLVGVDYASPVEMSEYDVGEPTLMTILTKSAVSTKQLDRAIEAIIDEAVQIRSDLWVLPSGPAPDAPADVLAGQQFRRFVEIARNRFDLVVAVGGEADTASSQVLTQRLGTAIVAIAPGKTTVPRITGVLVDLSQKRVGLPGVVMLQGLESRLPMSPVASRLASPTPPPPVQSGDPISRLGFYPFPGSTRSISPTDGTLDHLVEGLALGRQKDPQFDGTDLSDPVGSQVLEALENTDRARAFEPVAEYVVARIEDMMTAVPGQSDVSQEIVDVISDLGFVPLTQVSGVPTIWDRLVDELSHEIGDVMGRRLAAKISEVLTEDDQIDTHAVDMWLSQEFFRRHLARTDREPVVWHVSSQSGAVQILVNGRRLTDERIGRLTTDIVRRKINDLERELREARLGGDADRTKQVEADLKDAHHFEVALSALRGGTKDEAKLVYPWRKQEQMPKGWNPIWSEGIRPNIAPLQKLDLLAQPVLTDDELRDLALTG